MLTTLPTELMTQISDYLPQKDFHNLRLTSRALENQSRKFLEYHFRTSRFTFTREGLETLVTLTKNPAFASAVKELQLVLVTFPTAKNGHPFTTEEWREWREWNEWRKVQSGQNEESSEEKIRYRKLLRKRRRAWSRHQHDQNDLRTKSVDVTLLTEAIKSLHALESITTISQYDSEEPPWGFRQIVTELGTRPWHAGPLPRSWAINVHDSQHAIIKSATHSIGVVMGAIFKSGIHLKGSLGFEGAPFTMAFSKNSNSRKLSPSSTPSKTFARSQIESLALSNLKSFSVVSYQFNDICERPVRAVYEQIEYKFMWLFDFLPLMTTLEEFSIEGVQTYCDACLSRTQFCRRTLHDRSGPEPVFFRAWVESSIHFKHLRRLSITKSLLEIADIVQVLATYRATLESFKMLDCTIVGGTYLLLLQAMVGFPSMVSLQLDYILNSERQHTATSEIVEIEEASPALFQAAFAIVVDLSLFS